ncbi:MAG: dimethylmenaquinone methyltransferase [Armatimonadetes bacterium CG_4_10_14_3_um_filter_66_18]|nr:ubiquinone/menaquinone biosynthesis methyltransferase [Armatimonadota bacterium]PIU92146.1 MAG: dimethylmenaquinone methyltransferase [Armatimonadetes bacterium CG06_land_8_20_14_3_00_66_21]PIX41803.1 MAG: dimethylmenaquinone methyltransferase [Armatimonadetes bacterium CG_4_8_14_3_um_filter_66_20]PIY50253.1 MAG: dimethylmenaquinone methyltransferase [Armatimonadetes bacterium CG_4_10_14_3_um_filter_66_18]PIZ46656.1 MAG: dimethylmenaquinone methyltransferase [Armatimonadetes bacterium CG_4_1
MTVDKEPHGIAAMFSEIAPRYDLLNHLLSCGLDRYWRRTAVAEVAATKPRRVLDVCAGTGDLSVSLRAVGCGGSIVLADFALPMLRRAVPKFAADSGVTPVAADGLTLPFADGAFDAVMVAFGVRNFVALETGLREVVRVLRAGGTLTVLEFCGWRDSSLPGPLGFAIQTLVPAVGRLVSGHASAYGYLQESIAGFATKRELQAVFHRVGLGSVRARELSFAICTLLTGRKEGCS